LQSRNAPPAHGAIATVEGKHAEIALASSLLELAGADDLRGGLVALGFD
jgi:hypothetical protein